MTTIGHGLESRHNDMRLRDPDDNRFQVDYSELFQAGFYKLKNTYPMLFEALEAIHWTLERTPHGESEKVDVFQGQADRDIRLFITPRTPRYPALRVLIEIDGKRVLLWHVALRG